MVVLRNLSFHRVGRIALHRGTDKHHLQRPHFCDDPARACSQDLKLEISLYVAVFDDSRNGKDCNNIIDNARRHSMTHVTVLSCLSDWLSCAVAILRSTHVVVCVRFGSTLLGSSPVASPASSGKFGAPLTPSCAFVSVATQCLTVFRSRSMRLMSCAGDAAMLHVALIWKYCQHGHPAQPFSEHSGRAAGQGSRGIQRPVLLFRRALASKISCIFGRFFWRQLTRTSLSL